MQLSKKTVSHRNISFDLIKIIASFMVILYHLDILDMGYDVNLYYIPNINKICLSFCAMSVPLFFMINGTLTLNKERTFKYYLMKTLKTGFLYVFWLFFIKGILKILIYFEFIEDVGLDSLTVHLWFLRTLTILYALAYFIKRFYNNKVVCGIVCAVLIIFPFVYNFIIMVFKFFHITFFENMHRTGFFTMYSVVYYIGGKYLYDRLECFHKRKLSLALEIFMIFVGWMLVNVEIMVLTNYYKQLFDGVNASFPTLGALFMAFGFYSIMNRIIRINSNKTNQIIDFFSRNIMGVYLIHPIIIKVIKLFVIKRVDIVFAVVLAIIVMVISAMIVELFRKIPIIKKLFTI